MIDFIPLEISSSSRERMLFPNQFNFETTLNNVGQKTNGLEASDPITIQLPINEGTIKGLTVNNLLQWTGLDINLTGLINSINYNQVIVTITSAFSPEYNYYRGLLIFFTTGWSIVTEYIYMNLNLAIFKVKQLPGTLPAIGSAILLNFTTYNANNPFEVFVPKTLTTTAAIDTDFILYNETLNDTRKIIKYTSESSIALINAAPTWTNLHKYSVRKQFPFLSIIQVLPLPTSNSFSVNSLVVFPGDFVKNVITGEIVTILTNNSGLITYDPSTVPWLPGTIVEFLSFQKDSNALLNFTNIQREAKTAEYEVKLNSLILPNIRINNGISLKKLPFVYLEVTDKSNPITNSFMSNNPGSKRAFFKATLSERQKTSTTYPFLKFKGDDASKIIKFRPSGATFIFSVRNPNGEILVSWIQDTLSPYPPNAMLQCTVLLTIKKVTNGS